MKIKEILKKIEIKQVTIENEAYFMISNSDELRPFFMTIMSDSNLWMFISSNGGLTAGRKNSEYALFPYYTDDKITESSDITGNKSIFQVHKNGKSYLWEPFAVRFESLYNTTQNLYKNIYGNKILFEEINHDLELTFRYQWNSSNTFGFIKKSKLINHANSKINVTVLDGIQNIMPSGVSNDLQNTYSNLVDAYKRSEIEQETGLGIYALSAIITDKAEPSEALKANVVWSLGLKNPNYLLSSIQLKNFRSKLPIFQENDIKAEKGAYFIHAEVALVPKKDKEWMIIADVNKKHAEIASLIHKIKTKKNLYQLVHKEIELSTQHLIELNASSDCMQLTADPLRDSRHYSNTLFNIMRGGIFDNNYQIEKKDFIQYLSKANKNVAKNTQEIIKELPEEFTLTLLRNIAYSSENKHFKRICLEYLPLKFSRRHGDPSRPWNIFSINTRSEVDGSKILDYQGNWRDIFQNWEALVHAFPEFIESMIHKFLNATTFEGYNPYRITKNGFDWETIDPDDPWSYIGYWGDHQIIYLLKFLEFFENYKPGQLEKLFDMDLFVYANVPYKIKAYQDLCDNPKDTIIFDKELDLKIRQQRDDFGTDATLLQDKNKVIVKVNFIEKILATTLAKLSNFIPEAGIWMNTQRPEWNDANNALVGNGVSMVTLYYLRRFLKFFSSVFNNTSTETIEISVELVTFFNKTVDTLKTYQHLLKGNINNKARKQVLNGLGQAASDYRNQIYNHAFSGNKTRISLNELKALIGLSLQFLEHAIKANKRSDKLYHAYNLMTIEKNDEISISTLDEMLEGQVAILSSSYLSSKAALELLDALKQSKLFRAEQYSYLLYPNTERKGFLERNIIPKDAVKKSKLLKQLVKDANHQIIEQDINGGYHFNGNFKNANDLKNALVELSETKYKLLIESDRNLVLQTFENTFNHKAFTGRSGTFYGYEGLGSIYWHMVSKLLLSVQEYCLKAIEEKQSNEIIGRLLAHYFEIKEGLGVHKPPARYGGFTTDPYSHTPIGKGVQQPGMTGQVKEDILSQYGEFGVFIKRGKLAFNPCLLRKNIFLSSDKTFNYVNVFNEKKQIQLSKNMLCFTYCQVPMIYILAEETKLKVKDSKNNIILSNHLTLDEKISNQIFERTGQIEHINVYIKESLLK